MKFRTSVLLLALCLLLSACGGAPAEGPKTEAPEDPVPPAVEVPEPGEAPAPPEGEEPTVTVFRIVDGAEDGNLLLAKLCRCLGADVYQLNAGEIPVTLDGEPADSSVLEDGMAIEVSFDGVTLETFPAQMGEVYSIAAWSRGQSWNPLGTTYDLCGLYLQVLDDLWQKDSGLNENISQIALDLSQAPGDLTEAEKAALVWRFGELHGVEAFAATFEELKDQGCLSSDPLGEDAPEGAAFYHWEDGCLFSIKANEDHAEEVYSLPVIFFNAEKWRSSLGAYIFYDCTASWAEAGPWTTYQIGSEMIS